MIQKYWVNSTFTGGIYSLLVVALKPKACIPLLVVMQKYILCVLRRLPLYNYHTLYGWNLWDIIKSSYMISLNLFISSIWEYLMIGLLKGEILLVWLASIVLFVPWFSVCMWLYLILYLHFNTFNDTLNLESQLNSYPLI